MSKFNTAPDICSLNEYVSAVLMRLVLFYRVYCCGRILSVRCSGSVLSMGVVYERPEKPKFRHSVPIIIK